MFLGIPVNFYIDASSENFSTTNYNLLEKGLTAMTKNLYWMHTYFCGSAEVSNK